VTRAYTDGACRRNPGPGGWAYAVEGGAWAAGHDPDTTNQRMEIRAVLEATRAIDGPLVVVSDSTYVVNCWKDRWWAGWLRRGWKNSQKQPVANQDLWEPLVEVFRDRADFAMEWVKGHAGDPMNDLVDRLAVAASYGRDGSGTGTPPDDALGPPDRPGPRSTAPSAGGDRRIPSGWPVAVVGLRSERLAESAAGRRAAAQLVEVLRAQSQLHPDLVVVSGLRPGAEEIGAAAAIEAGVPLAVVLPYPEPDAGWPERERAAFASMCDRAREVVTLERRRPTDVAGRRDAMSRRDGWLRRSMAGAIVISDGRDPEAELLVQRFTDALDEEVWLLDLAD
jgi:ribonuclease HI